MIHRTIDGDMVDAICKDHYGTEAMAEQVYAANPGLASYGPVLPRGLLVELPDRLDPPVRKPIRLWG